MHAVLIKHYYANILCFLLKSCKYDCGGGGVNYKTSGMLKFENFDIKLLQHL